MTGLVAFLRKELTEIRRTWRLWVIPGMLVFLGLTSPVIAVLTPALVHSMAATQPGVVIQLPAPTALDASGQFLKNLDQFVLIAVVIAGAGVVSGERSSGTAILVLTKPLSRGAFVIAKIVSQVMLLVAATALGTAACVGMMALLFDGSNAPRLVTAVALWLLYASLLVVVMTLTLLFSNWSPAAHYSFLGLLPAMHDALTGESQASSLGWPLTTAAAAIALGTAATVRIFEQQEL